jgi:radical SAM-linked protein
MEKFIYQLTLYKKQDMVYFSQLDLVRILERALRRTNLNVVFTQGFNPRVRLSFSQALKLGKEGKIEVTLYFLKDYNPEELKELLSLQLPKELEILEVRKLNC